MSAPIQRGKRPYFLSPKEEDAESGVSKEQRGGEVLEIALEAMKLGERELSDFENYDKWMVYAKTCLSNDKVQGALYYLNRALILASYIQDDKKIERLFELSEIYKDIGYPQTAIMVLDNNHVLSLVVKIENVVDKHTQLSRLYKAYQTLGCDPMVRRVRDEGAGIVLRFDNAMKL